MRATAKSAQAQKEKPVRASASDRGASPNRRTKRKSPLRSKSRGRRSGSAPEGISQGLSRPLFQRMLELHAQINLGSFPNCRSLSKKLEVSAKTIQRDIDFMRDRLNLPIEYDQLKFGFYYTKPVTHFPSIEVSEGEVLALFVAKGALSQYRGTSFEKPLQNAFRKITDGLQERIEFQWTDIDSSISFRGLGTTEADIEVFETLSHAVLRSLEVEFQYKKLNSKTYENRVVQPLHLGCVENQWYLFAYDLARNQERTFALPRIRKAKSSGAKFKRPADFSIEKRLGASFGVFSSTGDFRIRIRFDAFAGRLVSERQWHATQKLKTLSTGEVELTLRLGSLEEIERWILSWGSHATVLQPKELVDRVAHHVKSMAGHYSPPKPPETQSAPSPEAP